MIRWLIASYIVLVLVFSAKARAAVETDTHLNLQKLNVQDPLPDFDSKSFRSIKFDSDTENFVG